MNRASERGQVLVVFAGSLLLLLLIGALVFDLGFSWMLRRQEQNAVDPAALAAAQYIPTTAGTGASSQMLAAACYYARQNGFFGSATTNDVSGSGCVPANDSGGAALTVNYPPIGTSAGEYAGRAGFVQVGITRQHPTFFLGVLGQSALSVSASAVAANTSGNANSYSLIALDPGCTNNAGQLGGTGGSSSTGKVSIIPATNPATGQPYPGGYVQVNSTCQSVPNPAVTGACLSSGTAGLQVSGGSSITAPQIFVSGTCANSGTITTNAPGSGVNQGALQVGDPLAELQPPSSSGPGQNCGIDPSGATGPTTDATTAQGCHFTSAGTYQLQPGIYYGGWQIGNKVTLQLAPGIYVMAGGGIKLVGSGSITSVTGGGGPAPVLIYGTDDPTYHTACMASPGGTGCQGALDLEASGSLDLAGIASGPYKGLLVWQDGNASCIVPSGACNVTMGGQTNLNITGTVYAPKVQVTLNGGGTVSSPANTSIQIISWWWQITGGSTLTMPFDPNQLYHLEQRGLVH